MTTKIRRGGKFRVGLVGCGAVGQGLARAISDGRAPVTLTAVFDIKPQAARALASSLKPSPAILPLNRMAAQCDILVEAASPDAVQAVVRAAIAKKRDVVVLSTAGILRAPGLMTAAARRGIRLRLPSGAMSGIDAVKAAACGKVAHVTLTTRKPPAGFFGNAYLKKNKISLVGLAEPLLLFDGPAAVAVRNFPVNVNVAATLSLAGVGPQKTRVRIFADPSLSRNLHEVAVEGDFGRIISRTENAPVAGNPKTSALAILSILAVLRQLAGVPTPGT